MKTCSKTQLKELLDHLMTTEDETIDADSYILSLPESCLEKMRNRSISKRLGCWLKRHNDTGYSLESLGIQIATQNHSVGLGIY